MQGNEIRGRVVRLFGSTGARFCCCALALVTACLCLAAAPALGALSHPLKATFGNIENPADIAVDRATGNVFVADSGRSNNVVHVFGPGGGAPIGVSPDPIEGFDFDQERTALAIDNSSTSASKGALYVVDPGHSVVKKFALDPTSEEYEQVGTLPGGSGESETLGVAVDDQGNVFVSEYTNNQGHFDGSLYEFSPTGVELDSAHFSATSPTLTAAVKSLTFDSGGNLFGVGYGKLGIWKFEANSTGEVDLGKDPTLVLEEAEFDDAAIDRGTDTLYMFGSFSDHVREYSLSCLPGCGPTREFGFGTLRHAAGIAVSPLNGDVYVGDMDAHDVDLFGAGLATLPDPTTGSTSAVTNDAATLNGNVSAAAGPPATCAFQYTTQASFEAEGFAGASNAPCEPAGPFNGSGQEVVKADLTGLAVNTTYRYRLRASNENGPNFGQTLTFATVGKPVVATALVSNVGTTAATASGLINPNGGPGAVEDTTYQFEYVSTANFETSGFAASTKLPASAEAIVSGIANVKVTQQLEGLTPGASYHLRLVAENEAGQTIGPETIFAAYADSPLFSSCGNEALRQALNSSILPDCRAFEQVTPVAKNGAAPTVVRATYQATPSGDGIAFLSHGGFPGTEGGQGFPSYFASRGSSWLSRGVLPPASLGALAGVLGWNEDLSQAYVVLGDEPGDPVSLYERDSGSGELQPIFAGASKSFSSAFYLVGMPGGGSQVFFETEDKPGVFNSYVWNRATGIVNLAGALAGGAAPAKGSLAGSNQAGSRGQILQAEHAVSDDGSRFFFRDAGTGAQLYMRRNPAVEVEGCADPNAACTVQISKSQRAIPDPKGVMPARFWEATPDGSHVFFTSHGKLTDDATTGPNDEGNDLYRYDAETGELLDLVPDAGDPAGADVQGVLGSSADGSYVYYVANGVLASGATAGDCGGSSETSGGSGTCSLYLWHSGVTSFVARLTLNDAVSRSDNSNWSTVERAIAGVARTARLTDDGQILLFRSAGRLTAYDSKGHPEFYRYSAADDETVCVSCNPTGVAPVGNATLQSVPSDLGNVPPAQIVPRNLSADGNRVFFETPDKLVAGDLNGDQGCPMTGELLVCQDVYEWEAEGSGSCHGETQNGGCLYLISDGKASHPAFFIDADSSGDDAFFLTERPLVGQDKDQLRDIYDARIGGGIASQNPAQPPPPCEGEACKGPPVSGPAVQTAGTEQFSESVVTPPCKPGEVRKSGHCVSGRGTHHKKKHSRHKQHGKKKQHTTRKHG
jgi:hypothetical protein